MSYLQQLGQLQKLPEGPKSWGIKAVFSGFFSLFYVCFKCKIRFRTYGIHHNIEIWIKNFTFPHDYEGGGGGGARTPS